MSPGAHFRSILRYSFIMTSEGIALWASGPFALPNGHPVRTKVAYHSSVLDFPAPSRRFLGVHGGAAQMDPSKNARVRSQTHDVLRSQVALLSGVLTEANPIPVLSNGATRESNVALCSGDKCSCEGRRDTVRKHRCFLPRGLVGFPFERFLSMAFFFAFSKAYVDILFLCTKHALPGLPARHSLFSPL